MRYYPVLLNLKDRCAVIVGGGPVAARKALGLIRAQAQVTVIAPEIDPSLGELAAQGKVRHLSRRYREGDLAGAFLAFAATDDAETNRAVAEEARGINVAVDVVDAPETGDFATPAVLERGDLLVTVSTGGKSPALAKWIVEQLQPFFGAEYREAVELFGRLREKILTVKGPDAYNKRVFAELAQYDIPGLIKQGRKDAIEQIVLKLFGPGFPVESEDAEKKDPS